ncbi:MAG: cobyric acid synthase CobQ, partial [Clostridiales bacterium]|nr:cobyric acid synthase CobQ [Clostridiales bacterium]
NGLEAAIKRLAEEVPVWGIGGGYQMMGCQISDLGEVEEGGVIRGMELLPMATELKKENVRCQVNGRLNGVEGIFSTIADLPYVGYENNTGCTSFLEQDETVEANIDRANVYKTNIIKPDKDNDYNLPVISVYNKNLYGTNIHGLFDNGSIATAIIEALTDKKGIKIENGVFEDYQSFKEKQYDKLADTLRKYLNMDEIYDLLQDVHWD